MSGRSMKILVAEDEPTDRLLLQSAVRRLGHECLVAADGIAAWELFRIQRPDVVISDWRMPELDGTQLCRRIRAFERREARAGTSSAYTAFVFVSGMDDREHVLAGMAVGADDYLAKPIDVEDLRARLIAVRRLKEFEEERLVLLERERAAREAAEQAIGVRDQVLSSLSHDLRSPLAAIYGRASLLRYRLSHSQVPGSSQLASELEHIERSADRMNRWLDELTDVALLDHGRPLELNREKTDVVAVAREAVADHHSPVHSIEVEIEADPLDLIGWWDRRRLERVLSNLVGNAIKYSPNGGRVRLCLGTERARDGWVLVNVVDEGVGIPAIELPRVFERFYRGSNVNNTVIGTGLGLAAARQVVEQHGGSITVRSAVGEGTTFTVRLPRAEWESSLAA
ncbi:MAG: ATP-binding protein [Chloroflexota bacterium]|nr:ATP-binding protein [Chloroflexota bacterium]